MIAAERRQKGNAIMKLKKTAAWLLTLCMALALFPASALNAFAEPEYAVVFDARGGTVDPASAQTVDGRLQSLPVPEYAGWTFLGWFTGETGGEPVGTETVFTEDTTVYAHYSPENGYALDLPAAVSLDPDSVLTETTVDLEGLEFYEHDNGQTPYRMRVIFEGGTLTNEDGTITVPYKLNTERSVSNLRNQIMRDWTAAGNPRSIFFYISDADRGSLPAGTYSGTVRYIVRWGYPNNGWSGNIETGTIPVTLVVPVPTYTVTFDPGEGRGEPIVYYSSQQTEFPDWSHSSLWSFFTENDGSMAFRFGQDCFPGFAGNKGKVFDRWSSPGSSVILTSYDTTITALWKEPDLYFWPSPDEFTLHGGVNELTIGAEALKFGKSGSGEAMIDYDDGEAEEQPSITVRELGVVLTDGVLRNGTNGIPFSFCDSQGNPILQVGTLIFRSGTDSFGFRAYVDPDVLESAPSGTYTGDMILYGKWGEYVVTCNDYDFAVSLPVTLVVPPKVFTVTFDAQGGTVDPGFAEALDGRLQSLPVPEYAGCTFLGWFTEETGGEAVGTETVFTGDTTVYAHYSPVKGYVLTLPDAVTLDPDSAFTAVTVDFPWLEFREQENGQTPVAMRLIAEGGTLTLRGFSLTVPYKLNTANSGADAQTLLEADWTKARDPRSILFCIAADDRDGLPNGTYEGSVTFKVRWGYGDGTWSDDVEAVEVPVTLEITNAVFSFTLDPGDGLGDPIVYYSSNQTQIPNWRQAQNCAFYLEENGRMGFRLLFDYCPESFGGSKGKVFDSWSNGGYLTLSSYNVTSTALWDIPERYFWPSPDAITLQSGVNSLLIGAEALVYSKQSPSSVEGGTVYEPYVHFLGISATEGTLYGSTAEIRYRFCNGEGAPTYGAMFSLSAFSVPEQLYILIDPDDYDNLPAGTYNGEITLYCKWDSNHVYQYDCDLVRTIALTLVVPPTQDLCDVNGDGDVNIADVSRLLDILSGNVQTQTLFDINNDGECSVADVSKLLDVLASKN